MPKVWVVPMLLPRRLPPSQHHKQYQSGQQLVEDWTKDKQWLDDCSVLLWFDGSDKALGRARGSHLGLLLAGFLSSGRPASRVRVDLPVKYYSMSFLLFLKKSCDLQGVCTQAM